MSCPEVPGVLRIVRGLSFNRGYIIVMRNRAGSIPTAIVCLNCCLETDGLHAAKRAQTMVVLQRFINIIIYIFREATVTQLPLVGVKSGGVTCVMTALLSAGSGGARAVSRAACAVRFGLCARATGYASNRYHRSSSKYNRKQTHATDSSRSLAARNRPPALSSGRFHGLD